MTNWIEASLRFQQQALVAGSHAASAGDALVNAWRDVVETNVAACRTWLGMWGLSW